MQKEEKVSKAEFCKLLKIELARRRMKKDKMIESYQSELSYKLKKERRT